ncbi:transposase [Streptomyces cyslabdanicus]|uniref:transposase n=1 Tax=Streptomyces cyslabdanicus TaxID=1470456 RepID=UPI0040448C52
MLIRDRLDVLFEDEEFAGLYPSDGRPGLSPGQLALVSLLQFAENLSDRAAADAVRTRTDWKYALVPGAGRSRVRLLGAVRVSGPAGRERRCRPDAGGDAAACE